MPETAPTVKRNFAPWQMRLMETSAHMRRTLFPSRSRYYRQRVIGLICGNQTLQIYKAAFAYGEVLRAPIEDTFTRPTLTILHGFLLKRGHAQIRGSFGFPSSEG